MLIVLYGCNGVYKTRKGYPFCISYEGIEQIYCSSHHFLLDQADQLSDKEVDTLHQIKAHDVRASTAFHIVSSFEQFLSACHWKTHITFKQFYLKDVDWVDSELYHLGPAVAAQQIHEHLK